MISKYFSFLCVAFIASACCLRCVHKRTSCPLSANTILKAVPQLPAPNTATFAIRILSLLSLPSKYFYWCTDKNIRSEEHTSELQSRGHLVCRLLLEKKKLI